jgi:methionine sulfoxide reductase heme-binding subunit
MTNASPHLFWITSRAAGIVALVLASLAVSLGLLMSLKVMRRRGPDLIAVHEILSLSTLVALLVHGATLLGDQYMRPSIVDISLPFVSSYKTIWTSIGIIAAWSLALLGLSYYARRRIGATRWRKLHRFTALAWIAGVVHSLGEGTDAGQVWFLAMIAIVVVPAVALLLVRYLTDEQPRAKAAPRRREVPAEPRPARPRPVPAGTSQSPPVSRARRATAPPRGLQTRRVADHET